MTRSVWPTSSERTGRALGVGYIVGSAAYVTAKVRSARPIRWGRRRATQQMPGQTVRPADRSEKRQAASPRTSQGSIPLVFSSSAAVMRDEWHGHSSNRDSRRHARFHFSPPDRLARYEREIRVSCRRWRVAVRGVRSVPSGRRDHRVSNCQTSSAAPRDLVEERARCRPRSAPEVSR
jgi:hypothetical protein